MEIFSLLPRYLMNLVATKYRNSTKRKIIGITGPSSFTIEVIRMVENFFESNPLLLYMDNDENLDYWMDKVSAVFLCGGVDLHPMTYNRSYPSNKNMKNFDLRRDHREIKIIEKALKRQVPMLGICRGHQLLGVYRKGMTMVTDLAAESAIIHCPSIQEPKYTADPYTPVHKVQIMKERSLFGKTNKDGFDDLWVNSFHHQGLLYEQPHVKDPTIIGTSFVSKDKYIVEMIDCPEEKWVSVQYHPEFDWREQDSSRLLLEYFKNQYLR